MMKQLSDDMKKQKNTLESQIMLSHQQIEFMNEEMENLRRNNVLLKETSEQMSANYEAAFSQQREESEMKRMSELKVEHAREMDEILSKNENDRKRAQFELSNMTKKCEEFDSQAQSTRMELMQLSSELNNRIDQLNDEIKHLKNQLKSL
jgi:peptidoglycan hydrolase CwlO-like protein